MEYALVLLWLVAFQALALVGLPVVAALFPGFPDRGSAFALPVALVVLTTVVFWLGHVAYGTATVLVGVGALVALSLAVSRLLDIDIRLDRHAETMAVFTLAYLFLVALRAVDPAVHAGGGEKFLDYGILKSLSRAAVLPPQDMWFAGKSLQYYYGGHLIASVLGKLTATAPKYAYNLALSGFYAMLVTGAYGLGGAIAAESKTRRRVAGALAAFFVGVAANLYTPGRLLGWLLPDSLVGSLSSLTSIPVGELAVGPSSFSYWDASRVIPGTINEFLFFSFLNGDLHAHMMNAPLLLVVAALGYAYYRTPAEALRRRRALVFGVIPAVVGFGMAVSTWGLPTMLGVVWLSLSFADAAPLSLLSGSLSGDRESVFGRELARSGGALVVTVAVGALTALWAAPFVATILLQSAGTRSIAFLPETSSVGGLLVVHGAFVLVFALFLLPRLRREVRNDARPVAVAGALLAFLGWQGGFAAFVVVVPLLVAAWLLLRARDDLGYEAVLLVAGAGLVVIVEYVYVQDNAASGRFNTVFKVYAQVWALWAVAAGVALARQLSPDDTGGDWSLPGTSLTRSQAMAGVAAALLVVTSVYPALALGAHFSGENPVHRVDDPTLDATAFTETFHPHEAGAIDWLDAKSGQPHIVAAPGWETYQWMNPASSLTGIPTVAGWSHETIYRGDEAYRERAEDVDTIFTGAWDKRAALLDRYDVRYVYVGPEERERYDSNLRFDRYPGIEVGYRNEGVTVYAVNQSAI